MAVALDLARLAEGRTSPNPMVGAVIVDRKGKIVAQGFHRGPGEAHAEIEALGNPPFGPLIEKGGMGGFRDTTLYITLEPCCPPKKGGRTPPCTDAILKSGIRKVVIGMRDPDSRVAGRGIRILRRAGIKVTVGVMEKECRELNAAYVTHRTKKRPLIILKMALSADGKAGLRGRQAKITGPEADAQSHALRDRVDAILVGSGTVLNDNPRLTTRLKGRKGRDPIRVILDRRRRISKTARVITVRSKAPTWIETASLPALLKKLAQRGVTSLLVEGGPRVWESFMKKRLVDRMLLFFSPRVLGERAIPVLLHPFRYPGFKTVSIRRLGEDLMIEADLRS